MNAIPESWKKIDKGNYATVYRTKENLVVKISNSFFVFIKHEYLMQRELYDAGISVPQAHELEKIKIGGKTNYALWMDYVPGVSGRRIYEPKHYNPEESFNENDKRKKKMWNLRNKEVEKAKQLGFKPGWDFKHNFIFNEETETITLIDFTKWSTRPWNFRHYLNMML